MKGKLARAMAEKELSRGKVVLFALKLLGLDSNIEDGGPGSGNFGHAGRPGKVGGSAKESGGSAFRIGSKEIGYSSFSKHKAFKGIVSSARASGSYNEFVKNMSDAQKDALRAQREACGTKENMSAYARRIYMMLHSRAEISDVRQKSVPVNGKNITGTFSWDGKPYVDKKFGQVIDTEIEAAIDAQGFNGVPKVVSHIEMRKMIENNPQMPILFRTYTANSPEELKKYDEMLEHGEWYVDCEKGGAQYGQGMYCAGVYQQEPLYSWDDPGFEPDDLAVAMFKEKGYTLREEKFEDFEEAGSLYVEQPYMLVDKDGNKRVIKMDEDSLLFEDIGKGGLVSEDEITEVMKTGKVYSMKETDIGIYKDAGSKERKEGIKRAKNEMKDYIELGMKRARSDYAKGGKWEEKDGMITFQTGGISSEYGDRERAYYIDETKGKKFEDQMPKVGEKIAYYNYDRKYPTGYGIWEMREDGKLHLVDGAYGNSRFEDDIEDYVIDPNAGDENDWFELKDKWFPVEGEAKKKEFAAKSTVRMMTLDPSAKIITYGELQNEKNKARDIRNEAHLKVHDEEKKFFDSRPEEEEFLYRRMSNGSPSGRSYPSRLTSYEMESAEKYAKENPERVEEIRGLIERVNEIKAQAEKDAKPYDRFAYMDDGVFAALMGYDAINAEGHGRSDSYTVVLNRTKVIISEDEVDVWKGA